MTLKVSNITKKFGGIIAVDDVSFSIDGEIVGLMGPNGSGKSTTINCISGVYDPTKGNIYHNGTEITNRPVYERARNGLARTFQTPRIFNNLTVLENTTIPLLSESIERNTIEEKAYEKLELLDLSSLTEDSAKDLSGGQKKLLEFARILMLEPDIILMDEPFAGVHPELKEIMREQISNLHNNGTDFLIVSHEVGSLYEICERINVYDSGKLIADGKPDKVQKNERVVEAYLGK